MDMLELQLEFRLLSSCSPSKVIITCAAHLLKESNLAFVVYELWNLQVIGGIGFLCRPVGVSSCLTS